jgi:hypothetical protein
LLGALSQNLSLPQQGYVRLCPEGDIQDALALSRNLPLVHLLILPLELCWEAIDSFRIRGVPNAPLASPELIERRRLGLQDDGAQWYRIAPAVPVAAVPVDHQSCEVHNRDDYQARLFIIGPRGRS